MEACVDVQPAWSATTQHFCLGSIFPFVACKQGVSKEGFAKVLEGFSLLSLTFLTQQS